MGRTENIVFVSAVAVTLLIGLSSLLPSRIYSSAIWHILWIAIAAAIITGIIMGRLWRNWPAFIMHIAFLFMIAGGFCTSLFSRHGMLHLLPCRTTDSFITDAGKSEKLPETVTLLSFTPEYYPGMNFPKDFKSVLTAGSGDTIYISMNHIGRLGNYRLYQTSYDDLGGTVLTVTHDPAGIAVTYTGFLLFVIGGAAWLLKSFWKFRLKKPSSACILLCFIFLGAGRVCAVRAVDPLTADSLSSRQVLFNGETMSFTRFSTALTYKLTGRDKVAGLSPEAFVASLIKYREDWREVPFIKVRSRALRDTLSISGKYASINDFYDETGVYIPGRLYKEGNGPLDKDIIALDEKIAFLIDLWTGELFVPVTPDSENIRSDFSIKSEILYFRVNPLRILLICTSLITAVLLLSLIFRKKDIRIFPFISVSAILGIMAYAWLWQVSESVPLSGTADIMEFLGVCMILLSCMAAWRKESALLLTLSMASASFLLLVAFLGMKDPVLGPLMPVLASPWLSIHVSLVMLSYGMLGFTLPVSLTALMMPSQRDRLTRLSISLIGPGVFLLGIGIITGSLWANVSWGRYWAWDPKETWSLVTLMLYSLPLHRFFGMRHRPVLCSVYLLLAFSSILMTYFGVNLLPSLHAYN
ncbi:MAG: cytochrome c biogenesis protein CcsA [Muribaculaceae bacterium]|nr:cytochrome c biogenesis protein CcsA [Muribaculaceae bacterium]